MKKHTDLLSAALQQICLTRDYIGEDLLPAIPGWGWYDVGLAIAEEIPDDEWAEQFRLRIKPCPECGAANGRHDVCCPKHYLNYEDSRTECDEKTH